MSWIDGFKTSNIVIISSITSFLILEFSYRYITATPEKSEYVNATRLFEAGNNFQNHDGFFKYFPNEEIRSVTLYAKSNPKSIKDLIVEYDYTINTNNLGLVMRNDVFSNERVVFVIGDSFTEGQGATPWFYDIEKSYVIDNAKIVNLGILGTGPQQWKNLAKSISKELQLDNVATVINIIPDDMGRGIRTFSEPALNCLHLASCDYSDGFQGGFRGYKFQEEESYDDIKQSVLTMLIEDPIPESNFKKIIRKSKVISDIYFFLGSNKSLNHELNESSIMALNKASSGNFFVNVVSQKNIDSTNFKKSKSATRLLEFLEKKGIAHKWCDIPANGYYKYDGHPNANGYKILRECTREAIEILKPGIDN